MTEHLISSGIETDDESHLNRILYQFDDAKIIILEENPIGFLKLKKNANEYEIIQIQIDPKYQGKGFGKFIIQSIIDNAILRDLPIKLSVLKTNKAKNLYTMLGFKIIEENKDSLLMELKK